MDWECKKVSNFLENSFCLSQFFDGDFVYLFLLKLRDTQFFSSERGKVHKQVLVNFTIHAIFF